MTSFTDTNGHVTADTITILNDAYGETFITSDTNGTPYVVVTEAAPTISPTPGRAVNRDAIVNGQWQVRTAVDDFESCDREIGVGCVVAVEFGPYTDVWHLPDSTTACLSFGMDECWVVVTPEELTAIVARLVSAGSMVFG